MKSFSFARYADPFQGNGEIDLLKPSFPASAWHFIKGLSGNTSPAACLPFGKYSVVGYDGAYPAGCGINRVNCGGSVPKLFDTPRFIGLSHFQQSGTGAIGVYYNYALCSPTVGNAPDWSPRELLFEEALPGYYAAKVSGVLAEATVSESIACHRYTLDAPGLIAVDFANDGLYAPENRMRGRASGKVTRVSDTELAAEMVLSGITLWFDITAVGGTVGELFCGDTRSDDGKRSDDDTLTLGEPTDIRFGGVIRTGGRCELRVSVSAVSASHAAMLNRAECRSFDEIRADAEKRWENALSKIEIETDSERERRIFYSNFYHTLVKPCDLSGEAFLFDEKDGPFVTDLATMWDIYKTQLPLLFTLYPDISEKLLATLLRFAEKYGYYPHCLLLSGNLGIESKQARMLAEYAVYDAYRRGVKADYPGLLSYAKKDASRFSDYDEGKCVYASHTLDMGEAYAAMAELAEALGDPDAPLFAEKSRRVFDAFGEDGMMRPDSDYYEGNRYNYSFRSLHDREKRLALCGGRAEAEALRFFGYTEAEDLASRFEGFNNETDMEAPLFLHDIGRRDLLCEVITSGLDSMFTTGRGGIPGNADSGGLTACYLWNALGIFPVSGQDRMIVCTPRYSRAVLHMENADFEIVREGNGIYVKEAFLNGRKLDNFEFSASEMAEGGRLSLVMTTEPVRA